MLFGLAVCLPIPVFLHIINKLYIKYATPIIFLYIIFDRHLIFR